MASVGDNSKEYIKELKKRFTSEDERADMTDREILALLMSHARCTLDTQTVVDNLYASFGSYENCFYASYDELVGVAGMTRSAAMLILIITEALNSDKKPPAIGKKIHDVEKMFFDAIKRNRDEEVYAAALDRDDRLLGFKRMAKGTSASADFRINDLVDFSAYVGAYKIVLAHTHPFVSVPELSAQDAETTETLGAVLEQTGMQFIGQVIVTDTEAKLYRYNPDSRL